MSDDDRPISELFHSIVVWALAHGGAGAHARPGTWSRTTVATKDADPIVVTLNPHAEAADGLDGFSARLVYADPDRFPGIIGIANPFGGMLVGVGWGSEAAEAEDRFIRHFNEQPGATP